MLGPLTPIPAPPNRQPNTGLLALANRPTVAASDEAVGPNEVSPRWVGGFGFDPESCADPQLFEIGCAPYAVGEEKEAPENPPPVTYSPAIIVAADACSAMSGVRDRLGRARRLLTATESDALERLLWTGEVDDTGSDLPVERIHLADGTATELAAGAAIDYGHGFALMDHFLTECLHNVMGMIHMTPYVLAVLWQANAVFRENGRWYSPNGNLIVAGAGYTGGGPRALTDPVGEDALPAVPDLDNATPPDQWIYGTSMVQVLLGDVETRQDENRAVNTITAYAERPAAAFWDYCCKFAAQLDFTPA